MICPNCNKEIKDDSKFCIFCGANVQSQSNARNDVQGASRHGDHEKHHLQRQPSGAAQAPGAGAGQEYRQLRGCPAFAPAGQAVP